MSEGTAAENQTSEATTNGTPNPDSQGHPFSIPELV